MRHLGTREEIDQLMDNFASACSDRPGTISAMISPKYIGCSPEQDWVDLEYSTAAWMCNIRGVLHGGVISTILDNAMGAVAWCLDGGRVCPTVSLQISFVRPIVPGDPLRVRSRLVGGGRSLFYIAAEAWKLEAPHRVLVSATAVYAAG